MSFDVIVTVGPAIMDEAKLKRLDQLGPCIYRLNGAHVNITEAASIISFIRNCLPQARIMMDLPGNKIRTKNLSDPIRLVKGESFYLYDYQVNFNELYQYVKPGDILLTDNSRYTLEVQQIKGSRIQLLSNADGFLASNKSMHNVGIQKTMPFLLAEDMDLLECAIAQGIDFLSLSFVRNANDVASVRKLLKEKKSKLQLFVKIETAAAVQNLASIILEAEYFNIDRGDLSAQVTMYELPQVLNKVVPTVQQAGKHIFLATQFLTNMETYPVPLISEAVSLYDIMLQGVSGIQLSEETAIGKYPEQCVQFVFDMYRKTH